ncbi:MAG: IS5/IS1182 family transposase, partial [Flavobacteriaceae bacterium]|nr:IS5/IS1182 family transposase [Flavobacteriaceae bacterium]
MIPRKKASEPSLFFSFSDTLYQKHPLYILANQIHWHIFEKAFEPLYCKDTGRPGKPIRLM